MIYMLSVRSKGGTNKYLTAKGEKRKKILQCKDKEIGVTIANCYFSGKDSIWTKALESVVVKWYGGS